MHIFGSNIVYKGAEAIASFHQRIPTLKVIMSKLASILLVLTSIFLLSCKSSKELIGPRIFDDTPSTENIFNLGEENEDETENPPPAKEQSPIQEIPIPNLVIFDLTYEEPFLIIAYNNIGGAKGLGQFNICLFKDDEQIYQSSLLSIEAGLETQNHKIHYDDFSPEEGRTTQYRVTIDCQENITESNEENNELIKDIPIDRRIRAGMKALDMNFEGANIVLKYKFDPLPSPYYAGKTFTLGIWVGEELNYEISHRERDQFDALHLIESLSIPENTDDQSISVQIPENFNPFRGEEYQFAMLLDQNHAIDDRNRRDNFIEYPNIMNPLPGGNLENMPDLEMQEAKIRTRRGKQYLTLKVLNNGPRLSRGNHLFYDLKIERCGDVYNARPRQVPLRDRVQYSISVNLLPGIGQNCLTRFTLDPQNKITEQSEENNVYEVEITLSDPSNDMPD